MRAPPLPASAAPNLHVALALGADGKRFDMSHHHYAFADADNEMTGFTSVFAVFWQ